MRDVARSWGCPRGHQPPHQGYCREGRSRACPDCKCSPRSTPHLERERLSCTKGRAIPAAAYDFVGSNPVTLILGVRTWPARAVCPRVQPANRRDDIWLQRQGSRALRRGRVRSGAVPLLDEIQPSPSGSRRCLITYVADRPGHDRRYAIDPAKIEVELGWRATETFESGLAKTVRW
jgi:hypothetical protein